MFTNFYEAFNYLKSHTIFNYTPDGKKVSSSFFTHCLDVDVQKVNPTNGIKEDDEKLNTKTEVWLEVGPFISTNILSHDPDLDCGGDTFEDAIINLANLVEINYTSNKETSLKKMRESYSDI